MSAKVTPYLGSMQPKLGAGFVLPSFVMGRTSKKDRPVPMIRQIVANNVVRLRDQQFSHLPNKTKRNKHLADLLGTSLSQVQRICGESEQDSGTSIDTLEQLSAIFNVTPQDLITAYFVRTTKKDGSPQQRSSAPELQRRSG